MDNNKEFEKALIEKVHLELTGHLGLEPNRMHFEKLQQKTGASVRKLKEMFGVYSKRSKMSHEYTLTKMAQYIGYEDWNSFLKEELTKQTPQALTIKQKNPPIKVNKKVEINTKKDKKVIISITIKGR